MQSTTWANTSSWDRKAIAAAGMSSRRAINTLTSISCFRQFSLNWNLQRSGRRFWNFSGRRLSLSSFLIFLFRCIQIELKFPPIDFFRIFMPLLGPVQVYSRVSRLGRKNLSGQPIANPIQKNLAYPANCQSNPIVPNWAIGQLDANWATEANWAIGAIFFILYHKYWENSYSLFFIVWISSVQKVHSNFTSVTSWFV